MKNRIVLITFLLLTSSAFASSGDGISFRFSNSLLYITWSSDQQEINPLPEMQTLSLIKKLSDNYDLINNSNKKYWIDYSFIQDHFCMYISNQQDNSWEIVQKYNFSSEVELFNKIFEQISIIFNLNNTSISSSYVYIVFIPNYYIDPDYQYKNSVDSFLHKSEIYLSHDMALQSNIQGYVYSIFFSKNKMHEYLKELDIGIYIVNRRRIDVDSFQTWDIMLELIKLKHITENIYSASLCLYQIQHLATDFQ